MTGTFDNWTKTEKLERVGQIFQKLVRLPESSDKIYYKVGDIVSFCLTALKFLLESVYSTHWQQTQTKQCSCLWSRR